MKANYKKAKEKSDKVLKENCVLQPPIWIGEIAEAYDLMVFLANPTKELRSGILYFEEKKIHINKLDSVFRQRFTIAHELGHFLMHNNLMHNSLGNKHIERRTPIAGEKDWFEQEADAFAANILLPLKFLENDKDMKISQLSEKYQVTTDVIGYQCQKNIKSLTKNIKSLTN